MQFNVASLLLEGIGSTRKYDVDETVSLEEAGPRRMAGSITMLRIPSGLLVTAHLIDKENETCSRCLKPVEETVRIDFEEEYHAAVDPRTGATLSRPADPEAFLIDDHFTLDLDDALRQYREVSRAIAPLCREDCKGLCPTCGADLNLIVCDCPRLPGD